MVVVGRAARAMAHREPQPEPANSHAGVRRRAPLELPPSLELPPEFPNAHSLPGMTFAMSFAEEVRFAITLVERVARKNTRLPKIA